MPVIPITEGNIMPEAQSGSVQVMCGMCGYDV